MLKRLILVAAVAAGLASPASAQQAQWPGVTLYDYKGTPVGTTTNPLYVSGGGGGGGGSGPYYVGQYNSTLPTFASGTTNYLSMDANGRLIIAPQSSVSISNFPATQPISGTVTANQGTSPWVVSNGGTFAVQNTAAVIGGNATAVKTDSSATTQPISAAALPLPSGAATSSNQSSEISALGAPADAAYAGSGNSSIVAALKGLYSAVATKVQIFVEIARNTAVAANGITAANSHDVGGLIANYTRFNVAGEVSVTGATLTIQQSNDAFATFDTLATVAMTSPNTVYTGSYPITARYYRAYIQFGSTAGNAVILNTSFSAN